jgi:hypothetical protein
MTELTSNERELFELIMQGFQRRYGQTFDCSGSVVMRAVEISQALADGQLLRVTVEKKPR